MCCWMHPSRLQRWQPLQRAAPWGPAPRPPSTACWPPSLLARWQQWQAPLLAWAGSLRPAQRQCPWRWPASSGSLRPSLCRQGQRPSLCCRQQSTQLSQQWQWQSQWQLARGLQGPRRLALPSQQLPRGLLLLPPLLLRTHALTLLPAPRQHLLLLRLLLPVAASSLPGAPLHPLRPASPAQPSLTWQQPWTATLPVCCQLPSTSWRGPPALPLQPLTPPLLLPLLSSQARLQPVSSPRPPRQQPAPAPPPAPPPAPAPAPVPLLSTRQRRQQAAGRQSTPTPTPPQPQPTLPSWLPSRQGPSCWRQCS